MSVEAYFNEKFWNNTLLGQFADCACYSAIVPTAVITGVETFDHVWNSDLLGELYNLSEKQVAKALRLSKICCQCKEPISDPYLQVCIQFVMAKKVLHTDRLIYLYRPAMGVVGKCRKCAKHGTIVVESQMLEDFLVRMDDFMIQCAQSLIYTDATGEQVLYMVKVLAEINRYPILKSMSSHKLMCDRCAKICDVLYRCSKCKFIAYCGPECAKLDWSLKRGGHKKECKMLQRNKLLF